MLANQKTAQTYRLLIGWKVQSNINIEKETCHVKRTRKYTNQKPPDPYGQALRNPGTKNSYFEQLGAAFSREQGNGLYVKLTGSQVISDGLFIFPLGDMSPKSGAAQ